MSSLTIFGPAGLISEMEADGDGAASAGARLIRTPAEPKLDVGASLIAALAVVGYADNVIGVSSFISHHISKWIKRRGGSEPLELQMRTPDGDYITARIDPSWSGDTIVHYLQSQLNSRS
jgi:hypothetical protein